MIVSERTYLFTEVISPKYYCGYRSVLIPQENDCTQTANKSKSAKLMQKLHETKNTLLLSSQQNMGPHAPPFTWHGYEETHREITFNSFKSSSPAFIFKGNQQFGCKRWHEDIIKLLFQATIPTEDVDNASTAFSAHQGSVSQPRR